MDPYVDDDDGGNQQTGQESAGVRSSPSAPAAAPVGVAVACSPEIPSLSKNVPVFLDRTFKMIGQVPDDIICWSRAGDSFIIKQVRARDPTGTIQLLDAK